LPGFSVERAALLATGLRAVSLAHGGVAQQVRPVIGILLLALDVAEARDG